MLLVLYVFVLQMKTLFRTMKYFLITFVFFAMLIFLYPTISRAEMVFSDVAGHQYRDSIQFLYDHRVVEGYPNGTFGPNLAINRAEIMKIILASSFGTDISTGSNCFPDVRDDWFAKYICYAQSRGMIQ